MPRKQHPIVAIVLVIAILPVVHSLMEIRETAEDTAASALENTVKEINEVTRNPHSPSPRMIEFLFVMAALAAFLPILVKFLQRVAKSFEGICYVFATNDWRYC
jgi:hypothetical protein